MGSSRSCLLSECRASAFSDVLRSNTTAAPNRNFASYYDWLSHAAYDRLIERSILVRRVVVSDSVDSAFDTVSACVLVA